MLHLKPVIFKDAEGTSDEENITLLDVFRFEDEILTLIAIEQRLEDILAKYPLKNHQLVIMEDYPEVEGRRECVHFDVYECRDNGSPFLMFKFWKYNQAEDAWIYTEQKFAGIEEALIGYPLTEYYWISLGKND